MSEQIAETDDLIEKVKALYRRFSNDELKTGDVIPVTEVTFPDHRDALLGIYNDADSFENSFSTFADTYDVFRVFDEDSVILDIGAHWGYSALSMRRRGAKAKIISVEALPFNAQTLQILKDLENGSYDFVQCAASDETADLNFYIPVMDGVANTGLVSTGKTLNDYFAYHLASSANSSAIVPKESHKPQIAILPVRARPIDEIIQELDCKDIVEAIKVDVEGHEAFVLEGARNLIRTKKPLIMIEEANRNPGVVHILKQEGYAHFERHGGVLHEKNEYSFANDGFWIHPDRIEILRRSGLEISDAPAPMQ